MSDTVIEVENLGKKYIIGHQKQERYTALRDVIADGAKSFWRSLSNPKSQIPENKEEFWALKDVSFEVKQGECIGIIGRNGAGKSTLLKILSRITEPTTGRIKIRGRVASLLEVGTGFHPELTGRENIFLNGSILGMSRTEIKAKFDEIVDFAEVERFLDTPVKFYSSGMYVRLAFAVAAHLEPEILIVDEVLAVGDAAFQKKCLGKMGDVAEKEGRTVLFVSHQISSISQLCNKIFFFKNGQLIFLGNISQGIEEYLKSIENQSNKLLKRSIADSKIVYVDEIKALNETGEETYRFGHLEPINLRVRYFVNKNLPSGLNFGISIKNYRGIRVFSSQPNPIQIPNGQPGDFLYSYMKIPGEFLTEGKYFLLIVVHIPGAEVIDMLDDVGEFEIIDTGSELSRYAGSDYGCVFSPCEWRIEKL